MTKTNEGNSKLEMYISDIKKGYFNNSILPKILAHQYFQNYDQTYIDLTTKIVPFSKRELISESPVRIGLGKVGYHLAELEKKYLFDKLREEGIIIELEELSPTGLTQFIQFSSKLKFFLVPRNVYSTILTNMEWRVEYNSEKRWYELKVAHPPLVLINLDYISDLGCIINPSQGVVRYFSEDGDPENRFIIEKSNNGWTTNIRGLVRLQINLLEIDEITVLKITNNL